VFGIYKNPSIVFHSSRLLNRPQEFQAYEVDEPESPTLHQMDDPSVIAAEALSRRQTIDANGTTIATSNPTAHPLPTQQSFYRKYIASATHSAQHSTAQQPMIENADLAVLFEIIFEMSYF
jgi:hypothetical protein